MKTLSFAIMLTFAAGIYPANAQKVRLGEVLVVNTFNLKQDTDSDAFETRVQGEMLPSWNTLAGEVESHFFRADRGKDQGSYWMVWSFADKENREAMRAAGDESGFSAAVLEKVGEAGALPSEFVRDSGRYTDYELVGADTIDELPEVELLGIHYIQVKPEQADAFDEFVRDTLNPALVGQMKGMDLIYYKGVRGDQKGKYLTVFAIQTHADREYYWPTSTSETEALSKAFAPLAEIAQQLKTYLVPGTFPDVETGLAAAIFESNEWTDFAILK